MSGFWGLADRWAEWFMAQFISPVCDELISLRCAIDSVRAELERGNGSRQVSVLLMGKSELFGDAGERLWIASRTQALPPGVQATIEFSPQRRVLPGVQIVCLGGSILEVRIGNQVQTLVSGYDGPIAVTCDYCEIGYTIAVIVRRIDDPKVGA